MGSALVACATVRALVGFLRVRGVGVPAVTGTTGLAYDEVAEIWRRAARELRDPVLGVKVAETVLLGAFGLAEHLLTMSTSLDKGLARMVAFYPLVNQALLMERESRAAAVSILLRGRDGTGLPPCYADFVLTAVGPPNRGRSRAAVPAAHAVDRSTRSEPRGWSTRSARCLARGLRARAPARPPGQTFAAR